MIVSHKFLLLTFWLLRLVVGDFSPEVHVKSFNHLSESVLYFDDAPVVITLNGGEVFVSSDNGKNWERKLEKVDRIEIDKVSKERAFAFTTGSTHYVSSDRGNSWNSFELKMSQDFNYAVSVNSKNPDQVLLSFFDCDDTQCKVDVYYTTDNFQSTPTILVKDVAYCTFTKSNGVFDAGADSRVICLRTEKDRAGYVQSSKLIASDDFFLTEPQYLDDPENTLSNSYIQDLQVVQNFIVVSVQEDKYSLFGSAAHLYISKDGVNFHKAIMDSTLISGAFQFLPSTKDALYVNSISFTGGTTAGTILASDSDGLHFRTLLNDIAFLSFEKVETIEGVWMANTLQGYDSNSYAPQSRTQITFDDGHTWKYLWAGDDCPGTEECGLNVLTFEERRGDGQGATGQTPGILMAIGNTGKALEANPMNLHTYVSRDGGFSWKKALDDPAIFVFGDLGNIIVAAPYIKSTESGKSTDLSTDKLYYSLDQGDTWQTFQLEKAVLPFMLITAIDGSTTNFLYAGILQGDGPGSASQVLYSLDFSQAFDKTCGDNDFENWYGRSQGNNEGECVFGHKDVYKRRKKDAKCFINKVFEDLKFEEVACECTELDYECAVGFAENSKGECVPDRRALAKLCDASSSKDLKIPVLRKIPGNVCTGDKVKIEEQSFNCDELALTADRITTSEISYEGHVAQYVFLDQTQGSTTDETLLLRTTRNEVHISHDGGKSFKKFETLDEIQDIYSNPYFKDEVYLVSTSKTIYHSYDRAHSFIRITAPTETNVFGLPVLSFSNSSSSTLIFYGDENCDSRFSEMCKPVAFLTEDKGQNWKSILSGVRTCDFVGSRFTDFDANKDTIFCQVLNGNKFELVSSTDKFSSKKVVFDNIVGFASTTHYTVVASIEGDSLRAHVTVDGNVFADASFPSNFKVNKQQAYTILGSETGAIFLHVTSNDRVGTEYGGLLKSNANGTSYVLSQDFVNRNEYGYVDYERVQGLEGIAIINIVDNPTEAKKGSLKQLQSKITFNDGSDWDYLQPPTTDSDGVVYGCVGKPLDQCALHLHGYTERKDSGDTFSSGSATGLLLGVGNVGDKLGSFNDASTYITADGGNTWKEIKKGVYQWEFGDRGSIVVLVNDQENTNVITYTLDEGKTWDEYQFTEDTVKVDDIITVPSDTSKKFLLITRSESSRGDESRTFAIDFADVFARQCVLDLEHPDQDDFEYWTPKHPFESSQCLFGHEAKYLRKLADRTDCFIGSAPLSSAFKVERNCACTRRDYECDFNYAKANDGTCKLIEGLKPEDHSEICRVDKNAVEYYLPTGYRKIPMSTCEGGVEFDKWSPVPCPGKEEEFQNRHGGKLRGFGLAMVIVIPILVFLSAVWFVYEKGIRRNGGFARFGEIRLGEDNDLIENNATDRVVNHIVRGGITVIAAVIATFKMIRVADAALIQKIKGVFTRNNRYARRGESYSRVDQNDFRDENDLLNDILDDDDYDIDDDADLLPEGTNEQHQDTSAQDHDDEYEGYADDRNLE